MNLRAIGASAAIFAAVSSANAEEKKAFLDLISTDLQAKILSNLDDLPYAVPLPKLECGKALVLKRCKGQVTDQLTFSVTETYRADAEIAGFHSGKPGAVYEVSATLQNAGAIRDGKSYDTLCAAIIAAVREIPSDEAVNLHVASMRKAVNRSKQSSVGTWIDQNGPALVETADSSELMCKITAQPESYETQ